jgi:hypothetical protein
VTPGPWPWDSQNSFRFANRRAALNVSACLIELPSSLGAGEGASCIAALSSPGFEPTEQGPADSAKPRIRRNVIEGDLACVGDGAHRKDAAVLDGDEERIVRLRNPGHEDFRRLVAQPPLQDGLVVPMIRDAQLAIDRLITLQAAGASSGVAVRISSIGYNKGNDGGLERREQAHA